MIPRRLLSSIATAAAFFFSVASGQTLAPRLIAPDAPIRALPFPDDAPVEARAYRLNVKFRDEAKVRATDGALLSRTDADLTSVEALAQSHGLTFRPTVPWGDAKAQALQARAEARTKTSQPDLLGIQYVRVPDQTPQLLEEIGEALQDLSIVEYAYIEHLGCPPPGDIAPATPDLVGNQGYLNANPGLNATYAWSKNKTGQGIRISDCEYGWVSSHEDLVDVGIHPEPNQTPASEVALFGWDEHGTAVLGETSATQNGYGCSGIAPDADIYTYSEWTAQAGQRRLAAITNAINDSGVGDVVLLEMQTVNFGNDYGPAELDPSVRIVCKMGVDAGVVVVGAAGNGNQNLDSPSYQPYMNAGDSGAIIVGAGSASNSHSKLSFSTYGSRVNVQGWGQSVFTVGYGDFAAYGGDKNQRYTAGFSGTSSASPFIASSCAVLQQAAVDLFGAPVDPIDLRQHLIDTGIAQGGGGHIGPFPNLKKAIDDLGNLSPPTAWVDIGNGLAGLYGVPTLVGGGSLATGGSWSLTLDNTLIFSPAAMFVGLSAANLPFAGGTLVPNPDLLIVFPFTSTTGGLNLSGVTPPGVPSGIDLYFQFWMPDGFAVQGHAASNAVRATSP